MRSRNLSVAALAAFALLARPGLAQAAGTWAEGALDQASPAEAIASAATAGGEEGPLGGGLAVAALIAPGEMAAEAVLRARPPEGASGTSEAARAEEFALGMPWGEESFESFRSAYLSADGKRWLAAIMARARPYMGYVAERVRYYGLPDELAFLPVIESEYSPKAVSKSGATGLWQFMRNSIGGYGIRIDDWVDERRDFMKSTDAALRKLSDNYDEFGDWDLALAAYNMGSGGLARALARARKAGAGQEGGKIGYWELRSLGYLSKETKSYVPKFLAVASILSYPARNGLQAGWDEAESWAAVEAGRSVDLGLLAEAAGLPASSLKAANSELRYTVTPPWSGYRIKVPAGAAGAVQAALVDPSLKLIRYYLHPIRSGDTLSAIARHYGTPVDMILEANPGVKPSLLRIGQTIVIPALKDSGPMPAPPKPEADPDLDFSGSYTVAKGDTLWNISLRYSVQPEVLADENGLSLTSVIHEGQSLHVPILK